MKNFRYRRWMLWLLALTFLYAPVSFGTEVDLPAAPQRSQLVRVWLTRLGVQDRMDLELTVPYSAVTADGSQMYFPAGSQIAVLLRQDKLYVYYQNMSLLAGSRLQLLRAEVDDAEPSGWRLANFPALYAGDLTLDIADEKIRPILSIHVEDYLLGVVPYEMSDSFPLEALKAQAVAARTYALRRQNASREYDVVDTTNDQVYKGYLPGNEQTGRAVAETRGVCGFYKGQLAQCYYSASNGGQTELTSTVWPDGENLAYYAFGEDPYDLANPASVVQSFEVMKEYSQQAPYALRKLLARLLKDELVSRGYDPSPESVQVDKVSSLAVDTPDQTGSKRMTQMKLTVQISGRTRQEIAWVEDENDDEISLQWESPSPSPSPSQTPEATATPQPTPQVTYGPFEAIPNSFTLDVAIFPTLEDALGLNISGNYENELWNVVEKADRYIIQARRYGHGVGMSQRGAQWMAGVYQKSYQDILGFYYPGMELKRYPDEARKVTPVEDSLSMTPGPAPTPTPRPTLMPLTQTAQEGQWYAAVTEIADDSSLNLRATPSMNGSIVMRLYKNQRLLVLERCAEDGWVHVCTDSTEGYVMEKYLTKQE